MKILIIIPAYNEDQNIVNLIIEVEEKQTGTFNAGVSVGTLDGFAIVTGLRERNFYGQCNIYFSSSLRAN